MSSVIDEITVESYHRAPGHKALADAILARGRLAVNDCYLIQRKGDAWYCHVYRRRGKRFAVGFRGDLLHSVVKVPA